MGSRSPIKGSQPKKGGNKFIKRKGKFDIQIMHNTNQVLCISEITPFILLNKFLILNDTFDLSDKIAKN